MKKIFVFTTVILAFGASDFAFAETNNFKGQVFVSPTHAHTASFGDSKAKRLNRDSRNRFRQTAGNVGGSSSSSSSSSYNI